MNQIGEATKEAAMVPVISKEATQFRVTSATEKTCDLGSYNRRDFYKISLIIEGDSQLLYANRGIVIDRSALVFTNPLIPYSWEATNPEYNCFYCVFTHEFLRAGNRMESFQESVLFKPGGEPVYFLTDSQVSYIRSIFERMCLEVAEDYLYKYDLLRNHVNLIIHEAIKMQPAVAYFNPPNAASRIAKLFLTLLEQQFPIESSQRGLSLKKASEYANQLSVHVNHLNAAVQEITGKSTTAHINERILEEAKSLLTHTDWSVAEIAFSLGFEYPSYFNNFFKRHTGVTPMSLRKSL
jgi:AraC-like DNA-binding protein